MSSDESTSTQISAISSQVGTEKNLKPHKSEQWEINLIGNFLLGLYHRLLITYQQNWMVNKSDIRKEFKNFLTAEFSKKLKELNGTDNIGTLLHRCGFIRNTPRGSAFYQISNLAIFEFRNKKLKEQDNWRLNNDLNNKILNQPDYLVKTSTNIELQENFQIKEDEPKNLLEYEGTIMQQSLPNYYPTNMSCPICQEDFPSMEKYEEHIQTHSDETEFEYLNKMSKFGSPVFTISYRLCKNSHYFCFDIETKTKNLVIEKIIIVQSRSFFYVHNTRVPYSMPDTMCEQFFVDSHLFTIYVEQPIVLICHLKDNKETRIIEEHHFMRCVEFPKVNFAVNPYRLPAKKTFKAKFQLADYFPPKEIHEALKDDFYNEKLMKVSNEFRDYVRNEKKLQPQTIGPSLNILLQIEDFDTLKQYVNLTQRDVKLRSFGDEYSFRLKPKQRIFVENVLSVFDEVILTTRSDISTKPEDLIQLMLQNKTDIYEMNKTFVGQIENVNYGRISFKCTRKVDLKNTYTVICRPSRLNIRYQYRSLELLPLTMQFLKKFLFPAQIIPRPLPTTSLTLYNEQINDNPEQLQAVRNIAEGPRNDATYIIFGPPGTGKTTTLVEAILQLLKRPESKILVAASSNSACDEVAKRLCATLQHQDMTRAIIRVYSRSSEARIDTIDEELLDHSNMYNGHFFPDVEVLHEYRIVICTLSIVAKLATGKFGRQEGGGNVYTHLFIDEVAATMETEALMAITSVLTPKSCLIIAGDHKQLGPILQSKRAVELGLGTSLMERLMARECYRVNSDTGDYDRTIQTRLRLNFRSHPDIVNLYSGMYYNHDLEPKADLEKVSLVKHWHLARNKEYPIIFHCVDAPSYNDNHSQSLYNLQELHVVMDYVKDLMYFGINGIPVKETDIGIISPYKKQYKRIQEELYLRKWFQIETGSVETFQGKEKNIIIVSFVRSGTRTLGFLENPRRLNVTISRAKSLLIMIGNPKTLSLNSDFEYIIKECQRHNTLVGSMTKDGDARKQHNKRLSKSTEKLNANRKDTNNARQDQQRHSNTTQKRDLDLKESMQKLDIKENISNQRSRGGKGRKRSNRRRRGSKSKNKQQSLDKNKENNSATDDDDDDDDSDDDSIDGDNKPSTSKAAVEKKPQDIKNTKTKVSGNSGKISKQYNKGKPNSTDSNKKKQEKSNIQSLFDDLPKVPPTAINNPEASVKAAIAAQVSQQYFAHVTPTTQHYRYPNYTHAQLLRLNFNNQISGRPMVNPTVTNPHYNNGHNQQIPPLMSIPYNMPQQLQQNYTQHHLQTNYMQQHQNTFGNNQFMNYNTDNARMQSAVNANNTNASNMNSKTSSNTENKSITNKFNNSNKNVANTKSSSNVGKKSSKIDANIQPTNSNQKITSSNKTTTTNSPTAEVAKTPTTKANTTGGSSSKSSSTSNDTATSFANWRQNKLTPATTANTTISSSSATSTNSIVDRQTSNKTPTTTTSTLTSRTTTSNKTSASSNVNTSASNNIQQTLSSKNNVTSVPTTTTSVISSSSSTGTINKLSTVKPPRSTSSNVTANERPATPKPFNSTTPFLENWKQTSAVIRAPITTNITSASAYNNTSASNNIRQTTTTSAISSGSATSYNSSSTGTINKLSTVRPSSTSSNVTAANVRPVTRQTSTLTPSTYNSTVNRSASNSNSSTTTSAISSGSATYYNSSSTGTVKPSSTSSNVTAANVRPVTRQTSTPTPTTYNSTVNRSASNSNNAPTPIRNINAYSNVSTNYGIDRAYEANIHSYAQSRPATNHQFGDKKKEESKCIIS